MSVFSFFFFSSRRRHTRWPRDWSSDVCSSDLDQLARQAPDWSEVTARARAWQAEPYVAVVLRRAHALLSTPLPEIGRASCREEGRCRWSPDHEKIQKNDRDDASDAALNYTRHY